MNKEYKCNHCDVTFSHRQSRFKHELICKKRASIKKVFRCDHDEMHKTKCSKLDLIETPVLIDYEDSDFMIERAYDASAVELLNEEDFDLSELSMVFNKDVERQVSLF